MVDSGKFYSLYKPTEGEIKYGLEVTVDNYTTYANPVAYTVKFQTKRLLPRGALLLITLPYDDIGVVDV